MIKPMTEMNLISAFAGESQAHMRYSVYSQKAEEGYPSMIRLFKAVAYAERCPACKAKKESPGSSHNKLFIKKGDSG